MKEIMRLSSYAINLTVFFLFFLCSSISAQNSTLIVTCATKVQLPANIIPSFDLNTSTIRCFYAWNSEDFVLMYQQRGPKLWSFLLSTPVRNSYIAVGFSPYHGHMVGSSAMVGWVKPDGVSAVKMYYLGGRRSSDCPPNEGDLDVVDGTEIKIFKLKERMYLTFQLVVVEEQPESRVIYSSGPEGQFPGENLLLMEHRVAVSTIVDYLTGESREVRISNALGNSHRMLLMIGWGILVPIGITVARYGKQWDPMWFYTHISIQSLGYTLGLSGFAIGFKLQHQTPVNVHTHKAIGILVTVLGFLQVLAFVLRSDKKAKSRRYWNWYHHNVGRAAIVFAIANIFYGLHLAAQKRYWRIGYGVFLGVWLLLNVVLEFMSYLSNKKIGLLYKN